VRKEPPRGLEPRTYALRKRRATEANDRNDKELRQVSPNESFNGATELRNLSDPDLQRVIDAWDGLPAAIRAGVVALVRASERVGE